MFLMRKIWDLVPKNFRVLSILVLIMTLVGTFLETIGIGLLLPIITLFIETNISEKYPILIPVISALGNPSQQTLLLYCLAIFTIFFISKCFYFIFLAWFQAKFIFDVQANISTSLYKKYIDAAYVFHLRQNTGTLIRNIISEPREFSTYALRPFVIIFSEISLIFALSALLIIVEPVMALGVAVSICFAAFLYQRWTKRPVRELGEERQAHEGRRVRTAQEGLGGIKDLKVLNREQFFISNYTDHAHGLAIVQRSQFVYNQLPRLWVELFAVVGLVGSIYFLFELSHSTNEALASIGVFAAAAFRIIPSITKLLAAIQSLSFSQAAIELLAANLNIATPSVNKNKEEFQFNKNISLVDVSYKHNERARDTIQTANMEIVRGQFVGLVGKSGAGKSTLVDIINGLLHPSSGKVLVDGIDIQKNILNWQKKIGYVRQDTFLLDDTLRSNIAFGLSSDEICEQNIQNAIKLSRVNQFVDDLPSGLDTFVGERGIRLSGGQRQRIGIARALYSNPSVLILDEATASLDMATEREIMDAIHLMRGSRTILAISHRETTLKKCDVIYRLVGGHLAEITK